MHSQQTIDNLQYQKTQLVKQIHEAKRQLASLDKKINILNQVTSESNRIQTFVDNYDGLNYYDNTFYYRYKETEKPFFQVFLNYPYPSKAISFDTATADITRYMTIVAILNDAEILKSLSGNVHSQLDWDKDDTTFDIRLNPDGTITLHAQTFDDWITHTKQRGDVTVSYGFPDAPDPLTILFDTEATVNTPEELPQLFINLTNKLNAIKEKERTC